MWDWSFPIRPHWSLPSLSALLKGRGAFEQPSGWLANQHLSFHNKPSRDVRECYCTQIIRVYVPFLHGLLYAWLCFFFFLVAEHQMVWSDVCYQHQLPERCLLSSFVCLFLWSQSNKTPRQLAEDDRQLNTLSWLDSLSAERELLSNAPPHTLKPFLLFAVVVHHLVTQSNNYAPFCSPSQLILLASPWFLLFLLWEGILFLAILSGSGALELFRHASGPSSLSIDKCKTACKCTCLALGFSIPFLE